MIIGTTVHKAFQFFLQYCSHQYWMGSINLLSFSCTSLLSINLVATSIIILGKYHEFFWNRPGRESNPGRRGKKRERYLCAMPTSLGLAPKIRKGCNDYHAQNEFKVNGIPLHALIREGSCKNMANSNSDNF